MRHELLLLILQKVGVNDTVLAQYYNYFNNKQQQIVTQESSSTPFVLCSKRCSTGECAWPSFINFNLYVSDLARLADEHGAPLPSFADDFTRYASCKDPVDACDTVSNVLGVLDKALGLQINEIKTVAMLIPPLSDKSSCENCKIVLRGSELNLVSETRLLGVIIDSSLSWAANIDAVCRKVGRKIGALRMLFRQLTPFARRSFFILVTQYNQTWSPLP